jgi:hypothetical protein
VVCGLRQPSLFVLRQGRGRGRIVALTDRSICFAQSILIA